MENRHGTQPETHVRKSNAKSVKPPLTVAKAEFLGDYRINFLFSGSTQRLINFTTAFSRLQGYYAQYRQPDLFQTFTIDNGNLVWGEDWDVIYPSEDLYEGKIG